MLKLRRKWHYTSLIEMPQSMINIPMELLQGFSSPASQLRSELIRASMRVGTRLHPRDMSTYGTTRHHPDSTSTKEPVTDYTTTLFRRLSWEGTVPLEIRVDPKELPANSDRGLECYYIQAPRVSYLPLLMPEIRRF